MKSIINIDLISEEERMIIAKNFLPLITKFYEDDINRKEYEIWLKKRNKIDKI